jgi:hypothetical protein
MQASPAKTASSQVGERETVLAHRYHVVPLVGTPEAVPQHHHHDHPRPWHLMPSKLLVFW